MKTKAIIHTKYQEPLILDEIDIPEPKDEEVVVKIFASGICSSQLINLNNPKTATPELLGHEATGAVIKKGKSVRHVNEGDQVLISWMPYNANINTDFAQWTSINYRGRDIKCVLFTWAEHAIMHSQFVSGMDKNLQKYTTSILGCAGFAGYGTVLNVVKIKPKQSVAVFGVGGVGILAVNAAKKLKADPIIAVDIDDEKLTFSKTFGATHTINSANIDPVEAIRKITARGADFVFDAVGLPQLIEKTILAAKEGVAGFCEGGTTVLIGFPKGIAEFNPRSILMGQRTYKGSRGGAAIVKRDLPIFYRDYKKGILLLDKAVTKRYKLQQINEAVQELAAGKILGRAIIEIS